MRFSLPPYSKSSSATYACSLLKNAGPFTTTHREGEIERKKNGLKESSPHLVTSENHLVGKFISCLITSKGKVLKDCMEIHLVLDDSMHCSPHFECTVNRDHSIHRSIVAPVLQSFAPKEGSHGLLAWSWSFWPLQAARTFPTLSS